jgi:Ca2+-binding EF-hand superfamily protein
MRLQIAAVIVALFPLSAFSQTPTFSPVEVYLGRLIFTGGKNLQQHLNGVRSGFNTLDANADGILSEADITIHQRDTAIRRRLDKLYPLLEYDINGDGEVTRQEIEAVEMTRLSRAKRNTPQIKFVGTPPARSYEQHIGSKLVADANNDGRIDMREMLAYANIDADAPVIGANLVQAALSLRIKDEPGVKLEALLDAGERVFKRIDLNNDGTVSSAELDEFRVAIGDLLRPTPSAK